jgi:tetratricopeptide (TPR) repeat protein
VKSAAVRHALLVGAVIIGAFFAYSNSFDSPFLVDNDPIILKDARIQSVTPDHIHRILTDQYWPLAVAGLYRPLATLSFLFNYSILGNGANPAGYHWFNLILHSINIGLVYALGLILFEQVPAALLLSALWGLHPAQTEAVTNIVGRADMLGAFGVLAALLAHHRALWSSGIRKAAWVGAVALAVAVGMFSKESAVVVIAVIALYDVTFSHGTWRSRIPSYAAVLVPCIAFLYVRSRVFADAADLRFPFTDNPLTGAGFWTARITAVKVIGKYLGLLLWPARQSFDYSFNEIPLFGWSLATWEDWKAVIALLACAGLAIVAARAFRGNKPVFYFVAFFFATLSPTSNLIVLIGSIMGERFLYLPSIGIAALAVVIWQSQNRPVAIAAASLIVVALAARTYARNSDWLDRGRFWRTAQEAAPGSYKTNLAAAINTTLLTQKDWDTTVSQVGRAMAILDPLPDARNAAIGYRGAGVVYRTLGDKVASGASGGKPAAGTSPEYWYRKSLNALLRSEKIELAQDESGRPENRHGKRLFTTVPSVLYLELGRTYSRLSDSPHALQAFERGRKLESDPDLLEETAAAYSAAGDLRKAAAALVEALAVDASRVPLTAKLVELYTKIDPDGCAVNRDDPTPSLNVDCPMVHTDICAASKNVAASYLRTGQRTESGSIRKTAIEELGCAPDLLYRPHLENKFPGAAPAGGSACPTRARECVFEDAR